MENGDRPDWSRPPAYGQHPPPIQPSGLDKLIPTKNPFALAGYYVGVFSLIPCAGLVLGPLAIIFGVLGLRQVKQIRGLPGTGHSITAIVLGSITLVANIAAIVVILSSGAPSE
ncbi:MAG: DUF4190 domain-containing protein [Fimbriimonadales bacterium]|nr:DUF4190 domain-containing protein [Fimbriimonadales bacterium]